MKQRRIVKVKHIDFDKTSRVNPDYKNAHALSVFYEGKTPVIYMDTKLPRYTKYGRRGVFLHEMVHVKIADLRLERVLGKWGEELYCDFESLVRTEAKHLHLNELALKKIIVKGHRWADLNGRRAIIERIVKMLELPLNTDQILLLTNYQDRKIMELK